MKHACMAAFALSILLPALAHSAAARQAGANRQVVDVPLSSERWRIDGEGDAVRFEQFKGRAAVRLHGGTIALDDADFRNGTVEFDMAFPLVRGFHGVLFRMENDREYEDFYFRSHLSGMPDANQYQPIIGGYAAWQLLHSAAWSSPAEYPELEWMQVRLVVQDDSAEVYLDSHDPEITFRLLGRARSGGLALTASGFNPVWFSNFSYSRSEESLRGAAAAAPEAPEGIVTEWDVSTPITEAAAAGPVFPRDALADASWRRLGAEQHGVVNLARMIEGAVAESHDRSVTNTIVARLTIDADRDRAVPVQFGYSDRVRVFLNGRLLYSGDNGYLTRDYRYLGTIGLFDTVWLNLEQGENVLDFAVSEDFGGWGVMARISDRTGLRIR